MRKTIVWDDIDAILSLFLDDTNTAEPIYVQAQRIFSWNWSLRFLAQHTPREKQEVIVVNNDERSAILPADFLGIKAIYDSAAALWLRAMRIAQGSVRYDDGDVQQFWIWGNKLHFERDVTIGGSDVLLYYWAYWPEVVEVDDVVEMGQIIIPSWAEMPLCHLTAATCLAPGAISAARIRNFNISVDSGRPTDNSRAVQAREHLFWWNQAIEMVAPSDWNQYV